MWMMLDIATSQSPAYSRGSSSERELWGMGRDNADYTAPENPGVQVLPNDLRESTAHYASPPEWVATSDAASRPVQLGTPQEHCDEGFSRLDGAVQEDGTGNFELSWGPWEHILHTNDNAVSSLGWWDFSSI